MPHLTYLHTDRDLRTTTARLCREWEYLVGYTAYQDTIRHFDPDVDENRDYKPENAQWMRLWGSLSDAEKVRRHNYVTARRLMDWRVFRAFILRSEFGHSDDEPPLNSCAGSDWADMPKSLDTPAFWRRCLRQAEEDYEAEGADLRVLRKMRAELKRREVAAAAARRALRAL